MKTTRYSLFLISILLICACNAFGQMSLNNQIVHPSLALSVDKLRAGDSFRVAVKLDIAEGFHVGGHGKSVAYPTTVEFIAPTGITISKPAYPSGEIYEGSIIVVAEGKVSADAEPRDTRIAVSVNSQGCRKNECLMPRTDEAILATTIVSSNEKVAQANSNIFTPTPGNDIDTKGLAMPIWLYLSGLLLAFTPCVYPMIPVTVGYFGTQTDKSHKHIMALAATYVLGIAFTYSVLGTIAAVTGGIFGSVMQSSLVDVIMSVILVVLALSMFDIYEIKPPAFIMKGAHAKKGYLGTFMMGLIFGIAAAPCVGPVILGLLTYVAKIGSPSLGFGIFFVFALGLGTPLFFLAAFSAKLPRPGMWMIAVKKIAGFLLIAAAAHFAEPSMPRALHGLLIPAVCVIAGIYISFVEKSIRHHRASTLVARIIGIAFLSVAVWLISDQIKLNRAPQIGWQPYELTRTASTERPVMIDFTADWCSVCKELERGAFANQAVVAESRRFLTLRVDATSSKNRVSNAAIKLYAVKGFPTVVFLNSHGKEVQSSRIVGDIDPAGMLKLMKTVE